MLDLDVNGDVNPDLFADCGGGGCGCCGSCPELNSQRSMFTFNRHFEGLEDGNRLTGAPAGMPGVLIARLIGSATAQGLSPAP